MRPAHFLPYAHQSIDESDIEAVASALRGDVITRGIHVEHFEKEFASYCGAKHAVAFNSGSAALAASYYAVDVQLGDRVITSPITFISTIGPAVQRGARPLFVDIDPATANIDLQMLALNAGQSYSRGKTILVPIHFGGVPVDMQALDQMLAAPDAIIIEDASHAIGSRYFPGGPRVGSCEWSHLTTFSLHPAKTITAGEGGVVTTNDGELARRLRLFRNNCIQRDSSYLNGNTAPWYYEVEDISNNYNVTDFQAALATNQLKRIESFVAKRSELVRLYTEALKEIPSIQILNNGSSEEIAFHLFVVLVNFSQLKVTRTEVMDKMNEKGIGTQLHYVPLYRHPCLSRICGEISSYFPFAEDYYSRALSLPLYFDLKPEEVKYIVASLKESLRLS